MTGKGSGYDDEATATAEAASMNAKVVFRVIPHWDGEFEGEMRFWADTGIVFEGADGDETKETRKAAWEAYHQAKTRSFEPWTALRSDGREVTVHGTRHNFTVDLLEERITRFRDKDGKWTNWSRDGEQRHIGHWPGEDEPTVSVNRQMIRGLAESLRTSKNIADRCTTCEEPATSYAPDGVPYCEGHLPVGEPA
jgi:thioesterase domain-containing protein